MIKNTIDNFLNQSAPHIEQVLIKFFKHDSSQWKQLPQQRANFAIMREYLGKPSGQIHEGEELTKLGAIILDPALFSKLISLDCALSDISPQSNLNFTETIQEIPLYLNKDYKLTNALFKEGPINKQWENFSTESKMFFILKLSKSFKHNLFQSLNKNTTQFMEYCAEKLLQRNFQISDCIKSLTRENGLNTFFSHCDRVIATVREKDELARQISELSVPNIVRQRHKI